MRAHPKLRLCTPEERRERKQRNPRAKREKGRERLWRLRFGVECEGRKGEEKRGEERGEERR